MKQMEWDGSEIVHFFDDDHGSKHHVVYVSRHGTLLFGMIHETELRDALHLGEYSFSLSALFDPESWSRLYGEDYTLEHIKQRYPDFEILAIRSAHP